MKIRSYKGRSLEKLYSTIHAELGPEAIIVSKRESALKRSALFPLKKSKEYELIAVVDDVTSDRQLLAKTTHTDALQEAASHHAESLKQVTTSVNKIHQDLMGLSLKLNLPSSHQRKNELPLPMRHWDARFVSRLRERLPRLDEKLSRALLRKTLAKQFRITEKFPIRGTGLPHTVVLVGPTGSGKTTTLAKLAARWALDEKRKVGLITLDTYRVAAVDQIKEYATLLGVELQIVFSAEEARQATRYFSDKEIILVDTPGRNHFDQTAIKSLDGILKRLGNMTACLVLPASVSMPYVSEVLTHFRVLDPTQLILTKIDETKRFDLLTTLACESQASIAFLTNGQRVPQDIKPARVSDIVDLLVPNEPTA